MSTINLREVNINKDKVQKFLKVSFCFDLANTAVTCWLVKVLKSMSDALFGWLCQFLNMSLFPNVTSFDLHLVLRYDVQIQTVLVSKWLFIEYEFPWNTTLTDLADFRKWTVTVPRMGKHIISIFYSIVNYRHLTS